MVNSLQTSHDLHLLQTYLGLSLQHGADKVRYSTLKPVFHDILTLEPVLNVILTLECVLKVILTLQIVELVVYVIRP